MKDKRVVLDTNLWVSFLISNRLKELDLLLKTEFITLVFSEELLGEFLKVSHRPSLKSSLEQRILKLSCVKYIPSEN